MVAARSPTYPHRHNPSTLIFWNDLHAEPGLKMVSLAARGLWTYHMLAIMAGAGGHLAIEGRAISVEQFANFCGRPIDEVKSALDELRWNGLFELDEYGTPFSPWMVAPWNKGGRFYRNPEQRRKGRLPWWHWSRLRKLVFQRDNYTCVYCGQKGGVLHCDHIEPVSRGGSDDITNLATACPPCNLSKGTKSAGEFLALRAVNAP